MLTHFSSHVTLGIVVEKQTKNVMKKPLKFTQKIFLPTLKQFRKRYYHRQT